MKLVLAFLDFKLHCVTFARILALVNYIQDFELIARKLSALFNQCTKTMIFYSEFGRVLFYSIF